MRDTIYKKSFELFLTNTDEKQVIRNFIDKKIHNLNIDSVLEIGAGRGDILESFKGRAKKIVAIEPNSAFQRDLQNKKVERICKKWEDAALDMNFDLILAPWVVTYFARDEVQSLIDKMYMHLNNNGRLIIFNIDSSRGSWRTVHNFFYNLIGATVKPSVLELDKAIQKYSHSKEDLITSVYAKNAEEMLKILTFDFYIYREKFTSSKNILLKYLDQFKNKDGQIQLDMVHQVYILQKS